jgi:hypothetical protein
MRFDTDRFSSWARAMSFSLVSARSVMFNFGFWLLFFLFGLIAIYALGRNLHFYLYSAPSMRIKPPWIRVQCMRWMSVWQARLQKSHKHVYYQTNPEKITEIAKQPGIANILDSSAEHPTIQALRNLPLVNALFDSPLWARTYDRKLTDPFGIESKVAKRIAASLQANQTAASPSGGDLFAHRSHIRRTS